MRRRQLAKVALIDERQARWKQLAVNDALVQAGQGPEAHALGQFGQGVGHALLIARLHIMQAIADYNPVDRDTVGLGPLLARVPD